MPVLFHLQEYPGFTIKKMNTIRNWIFDTIYEENKTPGTINYIFCDDDYLLDLNRRYLQHDYFTDVITFSFVDEDIVSGDIYISVDRIKDNSMTYSASFTNELHRVMIHGVLHLLGYDDKNESENSLMKEKEDYFLNKLDF